MSTPSPAPTPDSEPDEINPQTTEPEPEPEPETTENKPRTQIEADVVIEGTGIVQSLLACALSRIGKVVYHIDSLHYYSQTAATLPLDNLLSKDFQFPDSIRDIKIETPNNISEHISPKQQRKVMIDLNPQLVYARGNLVSLLITSTLGQFLEYRPLSKTYLWDQKQSLFKPIPATSEEIFLAQDLDPKQKTKLVNFLSSVSKNSSETPLSLELEPELLQYLKNTLSLRPFENPFLSDNEQDPTTIISNVKQYLQSSGVYDSSPFLYTLWGMSEYSQVFCRQSAIYQGNYLLNEPVTDFVFCEDDSQAGGVNVPEAVLKQIRFFPSSVDVRDVSIRGVGGSGHLAYQTSKHRLDYNLHPEPISLDEARDPTTFIYSVNTKKFEITTKNFVSSRYCKETENSVFRFVCVTSSPLKPSQFSKNVTIIDGTPLLEIPLPPTEGTTSTAQNPESESESSAEPEADSDFNPYAPFIVSKSSHSGVLYATFPEKSNNFNNPNPIFLLSLTSSTHACPKGYFIHHLTTYAPTAKKSQIQSMFRTMVKTSLSLTPIISISFHIPLVKEYHPHINAFGVPPIEVSPSLDAAVLSAHKLFVSIVGKYEPFCPRPPTQEELSVFRDLEEAKNPPGETDAEETQEAKS